MDAFTEHTVKYGAKTEDEKQIAYLSAGPPNGPLLIFLHGWPAIAKTWRPQLSAFAALGFRVVAPDMPGYGRSTSNKTLTDYAQQAIVPGMVAVLADTGREDAVWVAHDWGCGVLSSLAATHPHLCRGVVNMCVPYRTVELGLDELLKYVDRDMYPRDEYPYGQWSYQAFYEQDFAAATAWFDADAPGALRLVYSRGSPAALGKPAMTANVAKDGGWFGGPAAMPRPPATTQIPPGASTLDHLPDADVRELEDAMQRTGFFGADAYYMNHRANRDWVLQHSVNAGVLDMPVLFIQAKYDTVCDTVNSRLTDPMKKLCRHLTMTSIDAGHWVALEKPRETNAAITRWLLESLPDYWPGYYENALVRHIKK